MRTRNILSVFVLIAATGSACAAGNFGVGASYNAGMPLNDLILEKYDYGGYATIFEVQDSIPFKSSMTNFSFWTVYNFGSNLGIEAGFTGLMGYANEEAQVLGPFGHDEFEVDVLDWRAYNFKVGGRYNVLTSGLLRPYIDAGVMFATSRIVKTEDTNVTEDNGSHFGYYAGGALNLFITNGIAITIPVNAHFYTKAKYRRTGGNEGADFSADYKPPSVLTVGAGIEFYP